jgi:putative FmdB family regulatory protein
MPVYEFECKKCRKVFEVGMSIVEVMEKNVVCPDCGEKDVVQLFSSFSAVTSRKS